MARVAPQPAGGESAPGREWLIPFLSVLQLSDSAFPCGRYTLSHGLEAFAQSGRLAAPTPASTLVALLGDFIRFGVAPSDGVALCCAHRAAGPDGVDDLEQVIRADQRLTAVKLAKEVREASARSGRALIRTAGIACEGWPIEEYLEQVDAGRSPGNHAVVLGLLCAWLGVPRVEAAAAELNAFATSWVAAAVRLALTDHRTAQGVLYRIRPLAADAASKAGDREVAQISSCTPVIDVMAMHHEQAELRLFAS